MKLSAAEVARRLNVPIGTIQRWLRQGHIPALRRKGELVFELRDVETWAKTHKLEFSKQEISPTTATVDSLVPSLSEAIERGGVRHGIQGHDTPSVLRSVVEACPLPVEERETLFEHVLQREKLSSTGIGHGVAVPHPRNPILNPTSDALITSAFLETPIDFAAVDGEPVFVLFLILSPNVKIHLHLLARLAFYLRNDAFIMFLRQYPDSDELCRHIVDLERALESTGTP